MLTRANPEGMGLIVAMDFSPLAVGMGHIMPMGFSPDPSTMSPQRQENNYPEIASCRTMTVLISISYPQPVFARHEAIQRKGCLNGNVVTDNYFAEI